MKYFEFRNFKLPLGQKTYIMGILNVTPDSFSDGGSYYTVESAVKRAKEMVEEGADIIDIGAESTRPGFTPVEASVELESLMPVLKALVNEIKVPISIDTTKPIVAEEALKAGAHIINDVWGLQGHPDMAKIAAKYNAGVIVMHNKNDKQYKDLMAEIREFLERSIEIALKAGIGENSIAVDPGIGFGKTFEHNVEVMRKLGYLKNSLNYPLLIGTSRKSFIGHILDLPVTEREEGTAATVAIGITAGADIVRVHNVKYMARVVKVADAIVRGEKAL